MARSALTFAKERLYREVLRENGLDRAWVAALFSRFANGQRELAELLFFLLDRLSDAPQADIAENVLFVLQTALQNGLDPNYLYEEHPSRVKNIMWEFVAALRWSIAVPRGIRMLLEHGGDPNLTVNDERVFWLVDAFLEYCGANTPINVLYAWLVMAAYGGNEDNLAYPPFRMLADTLRDALKRFENYAFVFEPASEGAHRQANVLCIIDRRTGEKIAVNETL